jgi:hypothetical protein
MGERLFFAVNRRPQISAMAFKAREPGMKKSLIAALVLTGIAIGLAGQVMATPEYIKKYWAARHVDQKNPPKQPDGTGPAKQTKQ